MIDIKATTPIPQPGEIAAFIIRAFSHVDDQNNPALKKRLQRLSAGQAVDHQGLLALVREKTLIFRQHVPTVCRIDEFLDYNIEHYIGIVRTLNCGNLPAGVVRKALEPFALEALRILGLSLLKPYGINPQEIFGRPQEALPLVLEAFRGDRSWAAFARELESRRIRGLGSGDWESRLRDWRAGQRMSNRSLLALMENGFAELGAALMFARAYQRYCELDGVDAASHREFRIVIDQSVQADLDELASTTYQHLHEHETWIDGAVEQLAELTEPDRPKVEGDAVTAETLAARLKETLNGRSELSGLGIFFGCHALQLGDIKTAVEEFERACERFAFRNAQAMKTPLAYLLVTAAATGDTRRVEKWRRWCAALKVELDLRRPDFAFRALVAQPYPGAAPMPEMPAPYAGFIIDGDELDSRLPDLRQPDRMVKGLRSVPRPQISIFANDDQPEKVSALLAKGANPNKLCGQKGSALLHAVQGGSDSCFRLLLPVTSKDVINTRTVSGRNVLAEAVSATRPDWVRALLDAGAEVDLRDEGGCTPLYRALIKFKTGWGLVAMSDPDAIRAGVDHVPPPLRPSSSPFVTDQVDALRGLICVPSMFSAEFASAYENKICGSEDDRREVVALLLGHGADVNAPVGPDGFTPFLHAAEIGDPLLFRQLRDNGADVRSRLGAGHTAYALLHGYGHSALATEFFSSLNAADKLWMRESMS